MEYVNRRGERYYLLQGKTRTGRPKYYVSRQRKGVAVDAMPEGYEFYEHPERGIVTLRKILPSRLKAEERRLPGQVAQRCGLKYVIVDTHGDSLVVWAANQNPATTAGLLHRLYGPLINLEEVTPALADMLHYTPVLRFTLIDEKRRHFVVERRCYFGDSEDWLPIGKPGTLQSLAKKYLPHVGRDSFFELM